ncbi:methyl-accepting chemotaxis protein [Brevibacillus marinus]|uniref:methyl-accepting chemotaxis protein n=1 Tax=Brevibacillus marinus TaxID=2496837 RepID=UPI000F832D89|nr:methyl-accepting chemotaxis protein [Brevibacillus marinus]
MFRVLFQLIRNTLTNKEGFMIFILWNHLWVAAWLALYEDIPYLSLVSLGLLVTLVVSPYYFINKNSPVIRYLVAIGFLFYSISFDHFSQLPEMSFLSFIVLGFLAAYLDWKLIVASGVVQLIATLGGYYTGFYHVFHGEASGIDLLLKIIAIVLMIAALSYLCVAGQVSLAKVKAARNEAEEKEQRLRKLLDDIQYVSKQLDNTSVQVHEHAAVTKRNTDEMMVAFREVATGMETQANSTVKIDEEVQSIDREIVEVNREANNIKEEAEKNNRLLAAGIEMMNDLSQQMQHIVETVRVASETIYQLNQQAGKVEQIVSTIRQIADQTNLLALNAAIESARAGEHGRGFAVVADEVRKLAEQSASATQEISAILQALHHESQNAAQQMKNGETSVSKGQELTTRTLSAIEQVKADMDGFVVAVEKVRASVDQVKSRSSQVAQEMSTITQVTEESVASLEELFATAESQQEELNHITREIGQLSELAAKLQQSFR